MSWLPMLGEVAKMIIPSVAAKATERFLSRPAGLDTLAKEIEALSTEFHAVGAPHPDVGQYQTDIADLTNRFQSAAVKHPDVKVLERDIRRLGSEFNASGDFNEQRMLMDMMKTKQMHLGELNKIPVNAQRELSDMIRLKQSQLGELNKAPGLAQKEVAELLRMKQQKFTEMNRDYTSKYAPIYDTFSKPLGEALSYAGTAAKDWNDTRKQMKFFNTLEDTNPLKSQFSQFNDLRTLGMTTMDAKNIIEAKMRETESGLKGLETSKVKLEIEKLNNDLARQGTLVGRMGRSTLGQIAGPLLLGGAVTAGGLAAGRAMSLAQSVGFRDPTIDLEMKLNLQKVLDAKPMLKQIAPALLLSYYRIIFRESPSIGRDPYLAANMLERMVNYGGADHMLKKELNESEKAHYHPFGVQHDLINTGNSLFTLR